MRIRLPSFLTRDLPRKAVAVFFAIMIWLAADSQLHEFQSFRDVPVSLNYDASRLAVERRTQTATVTLRGARRRLSRVQTSDILVKAEVPVVAEGVYQCEIRLTADNVKAPPGTRVDGLVPSTLTVQVDRMVSKSVPVKIKETGELAPGYRVVQRALTPPTVQATGPSRVMEGVEQVFTEPVPLDETIVQNFDVGGVAVALAPTVHCTPATVRVAYEIAKFTGMQNFNELPVLVLAVRGTEGLRVKPLPAVSVMLSGPKASLESLHASDVRPFVDLSRATAPGRYPCPVHVWVDPVYKLSVEQVLPADLEVEIEGPAQEPAQGGTPPGPAPAQEPPPVPPGSKPANGSAP